MRRWLAAGIAVAAAAAVAVLWTRQPASELAVVDRALQGGAPAEAGVVSGRVIATSDLPPEGTRSLFDHLLAEGDGLPYPFEKLIDQLQRQHPQGAAPLTLMIPDGRSLLKASADHRHPRVLVAADFQAPNNDASLGLAPRGQLFLGFVEKAREIEVLSYNEAAGRFEFQLVQDYAADGARRIVYARRAICTTCHQGGGPIFPQRPWNETNGQPETAAAMAAARQGEPYLDLPLANPLDVPERFDELTDVGNFIPVTQRLWLDGCGTGASAGLATDGNTESSELACRRQMLKLALLYLWNPAEFSAESPEAQRLRALQRASWPPAGIAVPDNDLRNRDPLGERQGFLGWLRGLWTPAPQPGAGARDNEDLEAFDRLPKLPAALDPLTPRPPRRVLSAEDVDGAYGLAALFTDSDRRQLEAAAGFERAALLAAVDRIDVDEFAPRPFQRVRMVNALRAALAQPALGYCCLDTAELSAPVVAGTPPVELAAGSPLQHYREYCFACHRGNPARRLDFMSGATEAEVRARIEAQSSIRDALDWERYKGTDKAALLMPPADSEEYARLTAALAQNPALLDEMRAVVPGLFDF
jgi:hypothetical protein